MDHYPSHLWFSSSYSNHGFSFNSWYPNHQWCGSVNWVKMICGNWMTQEWYMCWTRRFFTCDYGRGRSFSYLIAEWFSASHIKGEIKTFFFFLFFCLLNTILDINDSYIITTSCEYNVFESFHSSTLFLEPFQAEFHIPRLGVQGDPIDRHP